MGGGVFHILFVFLKTSKNTKFSGVVVENCGNMDKIIYDSDEFL